MITRQERKVLEEYIDTLDSMLLHYVGGDDEEGYNKSDDALGHLREALDEITEDSDDEEDDELKYGEDL